MTDNRESIESAVFFVLMALMLAIVWCFLRGCIGCVEVLV